MKDIKLGSTVTFDDGTHRFIGTVALNLQGRILVFAGNKVYTVPSSSPYLQEETNA